MGAARGRLPPRRARFLRLRGASAHRARGRHLFQGSIVPDDAQRAAATRVPRATYRLQLNHRFTFRDAAGVVPYLADLGVSDLYASPYLQARPESMHGYDITDHGALNEDIGGEDDHAVMAAAVHAQGMGHLLDIVPNHMGIGPGNAWWMDVLENGPASQHAAYFDIDWRPLKPELWGKVLLPVLGDQYGCVLERGELRLEHADGGFRVTYHEHVFPVSPRSTAAVLREALSRLRGAAEEDAMELESIADALAGLPERGRTDPDAVALRRRERTVARRRLEALRASSPPVVAAIDAAVEAFNGTPGEPRSFDALDALLQDQAYRLAFWRVAAEEINYRRFFDVNELAGLRVERGEVFQATHRLVLRLVREGKVDGLRIDHPDGLYHPRAYLRRLQDEVERAAGQPAYVLVEKILTGEEPLPEDWPVAGTVGYEFADRTTGLFVARANEAAFDEVYRRFAQQRARFRDLVYEKKKLILRSSVVSELTVLAGILSRLTEAQRCYRDFTWGSLRDALREVIACFPVYRTYVDAEAGAVSDRDRENVGRAIRAAKRRNPETSGTIFDFIRGVLLLDWPEELDDEARREHARFVMKFQQLTGPVMAKGVEDTAFYVFNRLVSLNEVGGEPDRFGTTPEEMHRFLRERAAAWPHALNASSTHDTKRSEDVRARISVLSEMPEAWDEQLRLWSGANAHLRAHDGDGDPIPDRNDEYLLYQTLLGAWPLEEMDDDGRAAFVERIRGYMDKATREAKVHTSWINPNEEYDDGLRAFVGRILEPGPDNAFLPAFTAFQAPIARMGMLNALSMLLVKLAAPGVPDVYQGQETWDFSLVDPDNRRPVDYDARREMLAGLRREMREGDVRALARSLVETWPDGRIKMYVTHRVLLLRAALEGLFRDGAYVPLGTGGTHVSHLFAFARRTDDAAVIVAVPRLVATRTAADGHALPGPDAWRDTWLEGADDVLAGRWRNVFTGVELEAQRRGGGLALEASDLFADFPVAMLERVG